MRTHQRKLRLAVVEWFDAAPGLLAMTIVTPLSKASFMSIAGLVAIEAASRRIAKLDRLHVTAIATHCLMCTLEVEIRDCVIECFPIELDDVGRSPLVIGMTMVAFLCPRVGLTPVEPFSQPAIRSDFLVACEAKRRLRLSGKRLVTVEAVLFELGMSIDEWPGGN
jgi:hypothetical protein